MRFRNFTLSSIVLLAGSSLAVAQYGTPRQPQQERQEKQMMGQPGQGMHQQASAQEAQQIVSSWGAKQQEALRTLTQKFGPPDSVSSEAISWQDKGDYKKICILKDSVQHLFPIPHQDFLAVAVSCKVPAEKIADLAKFDGSITVNRTRGLLTAECDSLEHDLLALNLGHQIITDKISVEQASEQLAHDAVAMKSGQTVQLAQSLQFRPDIAAGDPGQPARTFATPESTGQPGQPGSADKDRDKDHKDNGGGTGGGH